MLHAGDLTRRISSIICLSSDDPESLSRRKMVNRLADPAVLSIYKATHIATSRNNSLTAGLRGMIGNTLVFRQVNGETILTNRPRKPRYQSELQRVNRQHFREATAFARSAMRDPEKKEYFRKRARKLKLPNAYTAAITAHLRKEKLNYATPAADNCRDGQSNIFQRLKAYVMSALLWLTPGPHLARN